MSERDRIETTELVIKDSTGRCRIRLGIDGDVPSIKIFDAEGTTRISLALKTHYGEEIECPEIELFNREGDFLACLGVAPTSETQSSAVSAVQEGGLEYEEPHLYLASRSGRSMSAIDLLVFGNEPLLLIQRAGQPDKYSLTIDAAGALQVKKNPFDA